MNDDQLAFIEDVGIVIENSGLPRMAGRVLGALLIADPPEQSAEELATTLQASRGSISTMTRLLIGIGLIERISKPGDRRDYFRNKPGAWIELTKRRMAQLASLRQLAERGLEVVNSDDPEVRRGLEEMRDLYAFWERELPSLFERWQQTLEQHNHERRDTD